MCRVGQLPARLEPARVAVPHPDQRVHQRLSQAPPPPAVRDRAPGRRADRAVRPRPGPHRRPRGRAATATSCATRSRPRSTSLGPEYRDVVERADLRGEKYKDIADALARADRHRDVAPVPRAPRARDRARRLRRARLRHQARCVARRQYSAFAARRQDCRSRAVPGGDVLGGELAARVGVARPHEVVAAVDEVRLLADRRVVGAGIDDVERAPLAARRRRGRGAALRGVADRRVGVASSAALSAAAARLSGLAVATSAGRGGDADVRARVVVEQLRERLDGVVVAERGERERDVDADEPRLVERERVERARGACRSAARRALARGSAHSTRASAAVPSIAAAQPPCCAEVEPAIGRASAACASLGGRRSRGSRRAPTRRRRRADRP